ncbi:MAG: hypothetical protein IJ910_02695 [Bacteroidaceae bacterium]|nr:hypothetical protein [Bacteroidaceae bacterium]
MKNEQDIRIPEGLNQRLSSLIDELDAQERKRKSIRLRWWSTVSVAACVALAISIGTHTHSQDEKLIEVNTAEEAQIQTERALMAFSQALNKGLRQIEKADETTVRTNERFQNCIK